MRVTDGCKLPQMLHYGRVLWKLKPGSQTSRCTIWFVNSTLQLKRFWQQLKIGPGSLQILILFIFLFILWYFLVKSRFWPSFCQVLLLTSPLIGEILSGRFGSQMAMCSDDWPQLANNVQLWCPNRVRNCVLWCPGTPLIEPSLASTNYTVHATAKYASCNPFARLGLTLCVWVVPCSKKPRRIAVAVSTKIFWHKPLCPRISSCSSCKILLGLLKVIARWKLGTSYYAILWAVEASVGDDLWKRWAMDHGLNYEIEFTGDH